MVMSIYGGAAPTRKSLRPDLTASTLLHSDRPDADAARPHARPAAPLHAGLVDSPDLGPDDQIALLAAVSDVGLIGLGALATAIPAHPRPISAILALVDAGLLALDTAAPFDADLTVWRVPPA